MTTEWKAGVVLLGYIAAFLIAAAAFALRLLTERGPDTSGGMYAAGDMMLFLAAFAIAALAPTGAALWFLRSRRAIWTAFAIAAFVIAMSGIAAMILYVRGDSGAWAGLSPLRILAAPLLALAFVMSGLIAPSRAPRIALLLAASFEVAVCVWAGVLWFHPLGR